jgi:hypothetical protein
MGNLIQQAGGNTQQALYNIFNAYQGQEEIALAMMDEFVQNGMLDGSYVLPGGQTLKVAAQEATDSGSSWERFSQNFLPYAGLFALGGMGLNALGAQGALAGTGAAEGGALAGAGDMFGSGTVYNAGAAAIDPTLGGTLAGAGGASINPAFAGGMQDPSMLAGQVQPGTWPNDPYSMANGMDVAGAGAGGGGAGYDAFNSGMDFGGPGVGYDANNFGGFSGGAAAAGAAPIISTFGSPQDNMGLANPYMSGAPGFDWSSLGRGTDWLGIGSDLLGFAAQKDYQNDLIRTMNKAIDYSDPAFAQRPFYQDMYKNMQTDPNWLQNDSVLQNMLNQATRNTAAQNVSQGYLGSGNILHDLQRTGTETIAPYGLSRMQQIGEAGGVLGGRQNASGAIASLGQAAGQAGMGGIQSLQRLPGRLGTGVQNTVNRGIDSLLGNIFSL